MIVTALNKMKRHLTTFEKWNTPQAKARISLWHHEKIPLNCVVW